jgi:hypothetical protein
MLRLRGPRWRSRSWETSRGRTTSRRPTSRQSRAVEPPQAATPAAVRALFSSSSSVDWTSDLPPRQQHSSVRHDKSTQSVRRTHPIGCCRTSRRRRKRSRRSIAPSASARSARPRRARSLHVSRGQRPSRWPSPTRSTSPRRSSPSPNSTTPALWRSAPAAWAVSRGSSARPPEPCSSRAKSRSWSCAPPTARGQGGHVVLPGRRRATRQRAPLDARACRARQLALAPALCAVPV